MSEKINEEMISTKRLELPTSTVSNFVGWVVGRPRYPDSESESSS